MVLPNLGIQPVDGGAQRGRERVCVRLCKQITMLRTTQHDFDSMGLAVPDKPDDRVHDAMQASGNAANRRLSLCPE